MGRFLDENPTSSYKGKFLDGQPYAPKGKFLDEPMQEKKGFGIPYKSFAFGGAPGFGLTPGAEEVLPAVGQTIGGAVGGFGGSVGGATLGDVARRGIQSVRDGKKFDFKDTAVDAGKTAIAEAAFRGAGKVAKPLLKKASGRLMNSVLKPKAKDLMSGKNLGQDVADMGIFGTKKAMLKKSGDILTKNEAHLNSILKNSKGQVDVLDIASNLDDLKSSYQNIGDDAGIKAISELQETLLNKSANGKISVQEANKLKRDIYSVLRDSNFGTSEVPARTAARKATARGLKEGIEKAEPNQPIKELNRQMGVAGNARNAIEKRLASSEKNNILGLIDAGLFGGGVATMNPALFGAYMGRKVLGSDLAKSTTAKLLMDLAKRESSGVGKAALSELVRRV